MSVLSVAQVELVRVVYKANLASLEGLAPLALWEIAVRRVPQVSKEWSDQRASLGLLVVRASRDRKVLRGRLERLDNWDCLDNQVQYCCCCCFSRESLFFVAFGSQRLDYCTDTIRV